MENQKNVVLTAQNAAVLANAILLGSSIIKKVTGGFVSATLNGDSVSRDLVESIVLNRVVRDMKYTSSPGIDIGIGDGNAFLLKRSYRTSLPQASMIAAAGMSVYAHPGSPVADLVSSTVPVEWNVSGEGMTSSSYLSLYGDQLEYYSHERSVSRWGDTIDQYAEDLGRLVTNHIGYVHSVVNPAVTDFDTNARNYLSGLMGSDPASSIEILQMRVPELIYDDTFISILGDAGMTYATPPSQGTMGILDPKPNFDDVSTGVTRLDVMIKEWRSTSEIDYFDRVWSTIFDGSDNAIYFDIQSLESGEIHERISLLLAYYLLCNYYSANLPERASSSGEGLERRLREHTKYAAALLARAIKIQAEDAKSMLISDVVPSTKRIYVFADAYNKWLSGGGRPEALMAILTGNLSYRNAESIDANVQQLVSAWNSYAMAYRENLELLKADSMRTYYTAAFTDSLVNTEALEVEYRGTMGGEGANANLVNKVVDFLYQIPKSELSNTTYVAREVVARIRYGHTPAYKFLCDMAEAEKANPDVAANEASFLAIINYVGDFIRGQVGVR